MRFSRFDSARAVKAFCTRPRSRRCSGSSSVIMLVASALIPLGRGKGKRLPPVTVLRLRTKRGSWTKATQSS